MNRTNEYDLGSRFKGIPEFVAFSASAMTLSFKCVSVIELSKVFEPQILRESDNRLE
jgi:hypothetical protein